MSQDDRTAAEEDTLDSAGSQTASSAATGPRALEDASPIGPTAEPAHKSGDFEATWAADDSERMAVAPPAFDGLEPGVSIGRYVLLEKIGAGGMGVVYAAYDPDLDRKIAVKVLSRADDDLSASEAGHTRLLREAQAMARLGHPNVIAVHDVGTFRGRVFVAMEYVAGPTLQRWLKASARSLDSILDHFIAAGRGLSAAHAVGLVHRDFKPQNVLVGDDGRVRVLDFGLARSAGGPETGSEPRANEPANRSALARACPVPSPPGPHPGAGEAEVETEARPVAMPLAESGERSSDQGGTRPHGHEAFSADLTRTGAILGTPGYMAPEQHLGQHADARSDQFSFCVALWEALAGQRPYANDSRAALALNVTQGKRRAFPAGRAPAWLVALLEQGLATQPSQRHPDLDSLLALIEAGRRPRADAGTGERAARTRVLVMSAATVALVALGAWWMWDPAQAPPSPCARADEALALVWNSARAEPIRAQFAQTGAHDAERTFALVRARIDAWTDAWAQMRRDTCEATMVRGVQSEQAMDRRMRCLDDALGELDSQLEVFAQADDAMVLRAVSAVSDLPGVSRCADLDHLERVVRPPPSQAERGRVDKIDRALAHARALERAGRYREAVEIAEQACAADADLEHAPTRVQCGLWSGLLLARVEEWDRAAAGLEGAYFLALSIADDETAVRAAARRSYVASKKAAATATLRDTDAHAWARHARAVTERVDSPPDLALMWRDVTAIDALNRGEIEVAEAYFRETLALRRELHGIPSLDVANNMFNLGDLYRVMRRYDDSRTLLTEAIAMRETLLGPDHPEVAHAMNSLAIVEGLLGDYDAAEARSRRVLEIRERVFGPDSDLVAGAHNNLGHLYWTQGRFAEAQGAMTRALEIRRALHGTASFKVGVMLMNLGNVAMDAGDPAGARGFLTEAQSVFDGLYGEGAPESLELRIARARMELALGHRPQARAIYNGLEPQLAVSEGPDAATPEMVAAARFVHAQLLDAEVAAGLARADARTLSLQEATAAEHWYASQGDAHRLQRERVQAYLAARGD